MQNQVIGHFRVHERIGAGGMGTVYRAEDEKLGREVALKFLSPAITGDPTARERFLREARAAAAIDHSNVCTVFEVGEEPDGTVFLAMPLYKGETLSRRLRRGALPVGEAVRVALQLLAALEQAHARGILHRDLKPSNVFLTSDGTVKLLDFGLARLADESRLTHSGTVVGTAAYMAPELVLARGGDHRADLWSAGVVLYEMLTGRLPFGGDTEASLVYAIAHNDPRPLRDARPELPEALLALVDRALAKEPEDRYGSAGVLRRDLELVQRQLPVEDPATEAMPHLAGQPRSLVSPSSAAAPTASAARPPAPAPSRPLTAAPATPHTIVLKRRTAWAGLATIVLLAAAGLAAWLLPRNATAEPAALPRNLAVLPVVNRSGDARFDAVAAGVGAVLVEQLGALPALDVVPYDEVLQVLHRQANASAVEVARELGAGAVLRGALTVSGDEARVELELVDGRTGAVRWTQGVSDRTDRLAGLQDRLAQEVTRTLLGALPATSAPQAHGTSEEAWHKYLQAEARVDETDDAELAMTEELLRDALRLDERFAAAHARLSDVLVLRYRSDVEHPPALLAEAGGHAERAFALAPDLPAARLARARVAQAAKRFPEAIAILRPLAAAYPNLADVQFALADTYIQNDQLGLAERTLRQALQRRPGYWRNWDALGSLLLRQGEYDGAREAYRRAASLTRLEYDQPYENLAALELSQGKFAAALEAYDRLPRPIDEPEVACNIGNAHYYLGHFEQAAQYYRLAVRLRPLPLFFANLGDAYARLGKPAEAKEAYGRAADLVTREGTVPLLDDRARQAVYLAKAGRCAETAALERAAAGEITMTTNAAADLAKAEAVCGDTEAALVMLRRAVALGYSADRARADEEFQGIAKMPRFQEALAGAPAR